MVKLIVIMNLFLLGFFSANSQSFFGLYIDETNLKEIDSLILYPDSTYRYAFYYPKYSVSEYYLGNWKYVNNKIVLGNSGMKAPAFILTPIISETVPKELVMTSAKLRKRKKGQILTRK